ncbi:MAG: hypothetical protein SGBAC_012026 [Bacillariaceae sp.]
MDKQEFQYDQSGRLSAEDELMMAGTSMELRRALTKESTTPSLPSTPDKISLMPEQRFKKLDMPKPFKI